MTINLNQTYKSAIEFLAISDKCICQSKMYYIHKAEETYNLYKSCGGKKSIPRLEELLKARAEKQGKQLSFFDNILSEN